MDIDMTCRYVDKIRPLFREITNIIDTIPKTSYRSIKEPDLQEIFGRNAEKPFDEKWEMIHALVVPAHSWQLVQIENGNYVWDEAGDISDVAIQIYENGWIVTPFTALEIDAVYSPAAIEKIKKIVKVIREKENAFAEKYNYKIAEGAKGVAVDEKTAKICEQIMSLAAKNNIDPVSVFDTMAARYDMDPYTFLYSLEKIPDKI